MALTPFEFLADVAAVYIGDSAKGAFGSGRLIAPGLIFTAGHVVDYPDRETPQLIGWKVRLLRERTEHGAWAASPHDAEVLWRASGELDLALLRVCGDEKPAPTVKPVIASYDQVGPILGVDAAGFPEAWHTPTGELRDYTVRGSLRIAALLGPYAWSIAPADMPDDPLGWKGMSGAAACRIGPEDKLYLFGAIQQVPANFSGLLQVARISKAIADAAFFHHLQSALGEGPCLVPWVADEFFGFPRQGLTNYLNGLLQTKPGEAIPAAWIDQHEKLAERADVSEKALAKIARHLGVEKVPPEELVPALIDRIDRLNLAQRNIQALPANNPIKSLAEVATENGEYVRAEKLLAVALDQIRAVKFISDGAPDLAISTLETALQELGDTSMDSPVDVRIVQGYIYKTLEQAFSAKGDKARADQYLAKAFEVFEALAHQIRSERTSRFETIPEGKTAIIRFAEVMNGKGNLHAARGQHEEAISDYQVATSLVPTYAYSWHDMFLSYYALAKKGPVDLAAMRQALAKTKQTGQGWPPFDPKYFAGLDSMMAEIEQAKGNGL
jgi:tetratricopeptide (TPR) repeat protein